MKASELMIGDFVTFKDCQNEEEILVIKIWQLNQDGNALVFIDDSKVLDEIAIDDEIVGISLTSEILEKNGFYLETYTGEWMSDYWWTRNDFVFHESMIDSVGRNNFKYNYVHELQHALKLCGIEKTIEL